MLTPLLCGLAACSGSNEEGVQGSINVAPAAIVRGTYSKKQNDCNHDELDMMVVQDVTTLLFTGGFDYQAASPDQFDGYVDESGGIHFTIDGGPSNAKCTATLVDTALVGSCTGSSQTCNFIYQKKTE